MFKQFLMAGAMQFCQVLYIICFPWQIHLCWLFHILQIDSARMSGVNEVRFKRFNPIQLNTTFDMSDYICIHIVAPTLAHRTIWYLVTWSEHPIPCGTSQILRCWTLLSDCLFTNKTKLHPGATNSSLIVFFFNQTGPRCWQFIWWQQNWGFLFVHTLVASDSATWCLICRSNTIFPIFPIFTILPIFTIFTVTSSLIIVRHLILSACLGVLRIV